MPTIEHAHLVVGLKWLFSSKVQWNANKTVDINNILYLVPSSIVMLLLQPPMRLSTYDIKGENSHGDERDVRRAGRQALRGRKRCFSQEQRQTFPETAVETQVTTRSK
jgi:hypothetical protein